jgi:hypothetical protein
MSSHERLEDWRHCWRVGFAAQFSDSGLVALRRALAEDDPKLIQNGTTTPPPLQCVFDWPPEGACPVGYAGWRGDGLETVGEVENYFGAVYCQAAIRLRDTAAPAALLNAIDGWPRSEMLRNLLEEVDRELAIRVSQAHSPPHRTDGVGESRGLGASKPTQVVPPGPEAMDVLRPSERPKG